MEEKISSKYVFYGKVLNLRVDDVKLPNKKQAQREIVEHNGGVCILALTCKNEVVLVKQYRYAFDKYLLELPAGIIDKGETHFEAAQRELTEETGITTTNLKYLGEIYPSVGYTTEVIHLYYTKGINVDEDFSSDEIAEITKIPLTEVNEMILLNKIADAKTITSILKYQLLINKK